MSEDRGPRTEAVLFCDGASSGNPGESGIGFVLSFEGKTYEASEHIGIATNNIAEYIALARGLSRARHLGVESVKVFLDSELLVKQLDGSYRVKNEKLKKLYLDVIQHLRFFKHYSIKHVPREQNRKADVLAKKAIKSYLKSAESSG